MKARKKTVKKKKTDRISIREFIDKAFKENGPALSKLART